MFEPPVILGVIALPALAPILALIQLLFPGLLGDHWKQYRSAIGSLLSQSTLMFAQWVAVTWLVKEPVWWLTDRALAWGMTLVATAGLVASLIIPRTEKPTAAARIEFIALGSLGTLTGVWLLWQWLSGVSIFDYMLVLTLACLAGLVHLLLRDQWTTRGRRASFATETIFLMTLAGSSGLLAAYVHESPNRTFSISEVHGEWTTYRLDVERAGSNISDASMPSKPALKWSFNPPVRRGEVHIDTSPIVVDGLVYVGSYLQVLASREGIVWCVNARDGRLASGHAVAQGQEMWRVGEMRAIFSSPSIANGQILIGEGYHEDQHCRLLALDASSGKLQWTFKTTSHVESTPTIIGDKIYFGAGDDGVYCLKQPKVEETVASEAWHVPGVHVDSGPLVAEGKVFVGGVVGDVVANLQVLAIDTESGNIAWRVLTDLPVPASPSYHNGGVLVSLGNGKMNAEHAKPRGAVWRLNALTGDREWEFPLDSSVLTSPVVSDDHVYFTARSGECYCVDVKNGERIWKAEISEPVVAAPIVSGNHMFVLTIHGSLHCLDVKNGKSVWTFEELRRGTADVYSSPVLVDGRIYAAIGGKIHCIAEATQP